MTQLTDAARSRRIQESLLAPLERKVLLWLAARMPERINSDHLTLLAIFSMALAGVAYALTHYSLLWLHAVNFLLLLHWFGDSLDGTLARYRQQQRPRYGYYVDHMMDSFALLLLLGGMALSPLMSERVAFAVLVGYLLLSINTYLMAQTRGTFQISFFKLGPTELRILLAVGNLVALTRPQVHFLGGRYPFFDVAGGIAAVCVMALLLVLTGQNIFHLYHLEKLERQ